MKTRIFFTIILLVTTTVFAGIRGPGQYQGVVVFDRWNGCYLHSAIYLMYIPEKLKESLRSVAGKSVVLDATEVFQPINPGDGRLEKFTYLGPSPMDKTDYVEQIHLTASLDLADPKHPVLKLLVTNHGTGPLALQLDDLAFTILAKVPSDADKGFRYMSPTDGPSYALQTRQSLYGVSFPGIDIPHWQHGTTKKEAKFSWHVRDQDQTTPRIEIAAGATKEFAIDLALGEGEYDLLFGYGGGVHAAKSVASNLVALDVAADATCSVPKVVGR